MSPLLFIEELSCIFSDSVWHSYYGDGFHFVTIGLQYYRTGHFVWWYTEWSDDWHFYDGRFHALGQRQGNVAYCKTRLAICITLVCRNRHQV